MFCTSASYLVARFHKVSVMHSRDTGPLDNLGPFGPIVTTTTAAAAAADAADAATTTNTTTTTTTTTTTCTILLLLLQTLVSRDSNCARSFNSYATWMLVYL